MTSIYRQCAGFDALALLWNLPSSFQTLACDLSGEGVAAVFTMPVDDTITHVGFCCASKTGTPADNSYTAGIQGWTAAGGAPDDAYLGGNTAKVTFPGAAGAVGTFGTGTYHFLALGTPVALQGGTDYSLVVQKSGADDAANYLTLRSGQTASGFNPLKPYTAAAAAGAPGVWTKSGTIIPAGFALRSATRTYLYPLTAVRNSQTVGTTTEKGFSFTFQSGYGAANALGLRSIIAHHGAGMAAGGTYTVNLYSDPLGTPTILQTTGQKDSDVVSGTGGARIGEHVFPEDVLAALTPGVKYGIGFSHSAAGGWGLSTLTVPDAGSRDAFDIGGLTLMSRTLASAYPPDNSDGAFTETTTEIALASLVLGEFTPRQGVATLCIGL